MVDTLDCITREELYHDKPQVILLGEGCCPDEIMSLMLKLQDAGIFQLVTFEDVKDSLETVEWYQGLPELFKGNSSNSNKHVANTLNLGMISLVGNTTLTFGGN